MICFVVVAGAVDMACAYLFLKETWKEGKLKPKEASSGR